MTRRTLIAAILTLLTTSSVDAAQPPPDEIYSMPEVVVTGEVPARPHPQDNTYSERPLGCVEIVTPSGTGNELGGYFMARNAPAGIAVMPNLNDPRSAGETYRRHDRPEYYQDPKTPPGQSIPNKCR
jgi:hypothetical protein